MFWSTAVVSSNIEPMLDLPDVTLNDVLDQAEVLQEVRSGNKKLIDYLTKPENLSTMLDYIITEPADHIPMVVQYKLPNIACEILTADCIILEKIAGEHLFLEKLFNFLRDSPAPLNPLLGSYVCRVLGEIIVRKQNQNWYSYQLTVIHTIGYLQSKEEVVEWLLKHAGTSTVCDFIYKLLLNLEGSDLRLTLFHWLVNKENFILRLMDRMKDKDSDAHANIKRLVCDLLYAFQEDKSSASQGSNEADPFLLALRSVNTISRLLEGVFNQSMDEINPSSVIQGLDVALALAAVTRTTRLPLLLAKNENGKIYDSLDELAYEMPSEAVLHRLTEPLETIRDMLVNPPDLRSVKLTHGLVEVPLGAVRLSIVKYVSHLSTLHNRDVNDLLVQSGILAYLMDLFWANPWNSFLHRHICRLLIHIVQEPKSHKAVDFLIFEHKILKRIIEYVARPGNRDGFRGYLAKIAAKWSDIAFSPRWKKYHLKSVFLTLSQNENVEVGLEEWKQFCSTSLAAYQQKESILLAGSRPPTSGTQSLSSMADNDAAGITWGASALDLNNDFCSSDTFSTAERYDMDKSRAMFEMFCGDTDSGDTGMDNFFNFSNDDGIGDGDSQNTIANCASSDWVDWYKDTEEDEIDEADRESRDPYLKGPDTEEDGQAKNEDGLGDDDEEEDGDGDWNLKCTSQSAQFENDGVGTDPWTKTKTSETLQSSPWNNNPSDGNLTMDSWANFDSQFGMMGNTQAEDTTPAQVSQSAQN